MLWTEVYNIIFNNMELKEQVCIRFIVVMKISKIYEECH